MSLVGTTQTDAVNGIFPFDPAMVLAAYLANALRPKTKFAAIIGSYGWGGGAVKLIEQELKEAGIEVLEPGLQVKYRPFEKELERCKELGKQLATVAKE